MNFRDQLVTLLQRYHLYEGMLICVQCHGQFPGNGHVESCSIWKKENQEEQDFQRLSGKAFTVTFDRFLDGLEAGAKKK